MIINTTDAHMGIFAGILVFDEAGEQMSRVQEIDTETLACTVGPFGKTVQAAGFVIEPNAALANYIPDGLIPFVHPGKNPTKQEMQGFIRFQLTHRQMFFEAAEQYRKDVEAYQSSPAKQVRKTWNERYHKDGVEETFSWPPSAFKTLAQEVRPTEEEEKAIDEKRLKEGKSGMVHEGSFFLTADVTTPWNQVYACEKISVASLWLYVKDEELVQWGIAVSPKSYISVVGNLFSVDVMEGLNTTQINEFMLGDSSSVFKQIYEEKWKVVGSKGSPNGTIELMLQNDKAAKI